MVQQSRDGQRRPSVLNLGHIVNPIIGGPIGTNNLHVSNNIFIIRVQRLV